MTFVVAVRNHDPSGPLDIPDVTSSALPFVGHLTDALGLPPDTTLPATTVLSVITTIAPFNDAGPFGLMGKLSPTPLFPAGHPLEGANGAFGPKWDILKKHDKLLRKPKKKGVGEVWVNTQFERVPGQIDPEAEEVSEEKPGTITVVDAKKWKVKKEINGLTAVEDGERMWNNPHNMWSNFSLDTIYNSNWFGKWINKIDRKTGAILDSIEVGEAPTHIITIPEALGDQALAGQLVIPLSADNNIVRMEDNPGGDLMKVGSFESGILAGTDGLHPHGHWLNCGEGDRITVPNVFNGLGPFGKISIIDTASGLTQGEFDLLSNGVVMPIAVGECHVDIGGIEVNKAYVSDIVTGKVHVIDVGSAGGDAPSFIASIPVTIRPDGVVGGDLFNTLQVPLQTPVTPDGKFVITAVLSLTTVPRPLAALGGQGSSADHVAIIDAKTDTVVKVLGTPAGTHGVNYGAKKGGGYYAYVTSQFSNVLTVIDPDPNGDGDANDAKVAGTILLANGSAGAGVTDGTGGQGVHPIPEVHDGWIQPTVELAKQGKVSKEVKKWIKKLTADQKNPEHGH